MRRRATLTGIALLTTTGLFLAGCSNGDDAEPDANGEGNPDSEEVEETWAGEPEPYSMTGEDFRVGLWEGDANSTTVECSGDQNDPTMQVTSPEGDEMVLEPGDPIVVTVTTSDDYTYTREDDEDLEIGSTTGTVEFSQLLPLDENGDSITGEGTIRGKWTCSQ